MTRSNSQRGWQKVDATDKWPGVCSSLGIDVGDGRHTICPLCGKMNFRFDDKGKGLWICTCNNGDGWDLVMAVLGCDFKSAAEQIRPLLGEIVPSARCKEPTADPATLRKMFVESTPAVQTDLVGKYLRTRGLSGKIPNGLRYHPKCWESETKKNQPAMLAVVSLPDGTAATLHRTYLTFGGEKLRIESPKKLMPGVKKATGGAIRLFDPIGGAIGVAEGIETAIACEELHGMPTWATVNAGMMAAFVPPVGIRKVYIYGDNDAHKTYAGQAAAYALAKRLLEVNKIPVDVIIPDGPGDWLDVLVNGR